MGIDSAVNLEDVRRLARRRLPKMAFDFIDGGVEGEACLARNRAAFERLTLTPRYLVDVDQRDQSAELFGRRYASPFGVSPAGMAALFRPKADHMLAEASAEMNFPFQLSAASDLSIEAAAKIAPDTLWFQIYGARDSAIMDDQARRAAGAGVKVLTLTLDVPIVPRRERNIRNGFARPVKITPGRVLEGLAHPGWLIGFLSHGGVPLMANWAAYAPEGADKDQVADMFGKQTPASAQNWTVLDRIRRLWDGKLVVKGVLHPDDAVRAVEAGVDAVMVSNHGGRQLDSAPSPIEMLPAIRAVVGDRARLLIDSGLRRGSDMLAARCLGADFAFFARPTLFGAAAAGRAGIAKVIEIVRAEIDVTLAQIGCPSLDQLDDSFLTETVLGRFEKERRT